MKERKPFIPEYGKHYQNEGGGTYECLSSPDQDGTVTLRNIVSGWTFRAHGCGIYDGGGIDWNYSTEGHFVNSGQQYTGDMETFAEAVEAYGKEKQVDVAIEEMAELTTELLHERRGRESHIAEEIADVQIMLFQLEVIFGIHDDIINEYGKKVVRLDRRLEQRKKNRREYYQTGQEDSGE